MLAGENLGPLRAGLRRAGQEDAARTGRVWPGALQWRTDHLPWRGGLEVSSDLTSSQATLYFGLQDQLRAVYRSHRSLRRNRGGRPGDR